MSTAPTQLHERLHKAYQGMTKYIPEPSYPLLIDLLSQAPIVVKVVNPRATKLGDYRPKWQKTGKPLITINADLNPYAFLITLIHELAHHHTYIAHGNRVAPHGQEWKSIYQNMAKPFTEKSGIFPDDVLKALRRYFTATFASSCADPELYKVLTRYNSNASNEVFLEELGEDSVFELNGRIFRKGPLRRKRFVCLELKTNRNYLVNAVSQVRKLD
jgi:SprT protein